MGDGPTSPENITPLKNPNVVQKGVDKVKDAMVNAIDKIPTFGPLKDRPGERQKTKLMQELNLSEQSYKFFEDTAVGNIDTERDAFVAGNENASKDQHDLEFYSAKLARKDTLILRDSHWEPVVNPETGKFRETSDPETTTFLRQTLEDQLAKSGVVLPKEELDNRLNNYVKESKDVSQAEALLGKDVDVFARLREVYGGEFCIKALSYDRSGATIINQKDFLLDSKTGKPIDIISLSSAEKNKILRSELIMKTIRELDVKGRIEVDMRDARGHQEDLILPPIEVDRHDEKIVKGIEDAPVYKKQGEVRAQIARGGEVVVTKLADGTTETKNTALLGDAIVTNPGGEQYIVPSEKFAKRYEPKEGEEGVYSAKGYCKAIDNPFASPITMKASWGEMQNGGIDAKVADTYDPKTNTLGGEPYIIALTEFNQTYKPVEVNSQSPQASSPVSQ